MPPARGRQRGRAKDRITPMHGGAGRPALRDRRVEARKYRGSGAWRGRNCWSHASCRTRSRRGSAATMTPCSTSGDRALRAGRPRAAGAGRGRGAHLRHRALDGRAWSSGCPSGCGSSPRSRSATSISTSRPAAARGIVATNTPDVLTEATADVAMLCLLGAARRAWEGETHAARAPLGPPEHDRAAGARAARPRAGHRRHGADRAGDGTAGARFRHDHPLSQSPPAAGRQGAGRRVPCNARGAAAALPLPVAQLPGRRRDPSSDQRTDDRPCFRRARSWSTRPAARWSTTTR